MTSLPPEKRRPVLGFITKPINYLFLGSRDAETTRAWFPVPVLLSSFWGHGVLSQSPSCQLPTLAAPQKSFQVPEQLRIRARAASTGPGVRCLPRSAPPAPPAASPFLLRFPGHVFTITESSRSVPAARPLLQAAAAVASVLRCHLHRICDCIFPSRMLAVLSPPPPFFFPWTRCPLFHPARWKRNLFARIPLYQRVRQRW